MRHFVSFDIGGTLIKYGVLTESGTFIEKHETFTEAHLGGPSILEKVKNIGSQLIEKHEISGICISTAGQVDSRNGKILFAIPSLIPDYTGLEVKKELEEYFNLPVEVENDVNCVGLAESWVGTGKNVNSLFCLTIGTGIGGSYILDNKLHTGHSFSGGEIGYIQIEGQQFQELASTRILVNKVAKLKGISAEEIDGKKIFEWAKQGDEICIEEIDRMASYISKGIATIAYMMNPQMVVIGGGISAQKDYLFPLIMKHLKEDLIPSILKNTMIEFAHNQNDAGMIGALRHFLIKESLYPLNTIITLIESNTHKLTKSEKTLGTFVLQNMDRVPYLTISELSKETNVSEATITRFCQKLKIGSYNKLRLMAKEAMASNRQIADTGISELKDLKEKYLKLLRKFDTLYEPHDFHELKKYLLFSKQLFIYCTSDLEHTMNQLKYKLINHSIDAKVFTNTYQMQSSLQLINKDTIVIGISLSGYDDDIIKFFLKTKQFGVKTFGITSQKDSPLTTVSDHVLFVPSAEETDQGNRSIDEVSLYYLIDIILNNFKKT